MNRVMMIVLAIGLLAMAVATPAMSEDLVGTVVDQDGQAVAGAQVVAQTPNGQTTATATSDAQGQYQIGGLSAGEYFITLAPGIASAPGQTVAGYVGGSGLTVNWAVGHGIQPVASAHTGAESQGPASPFSDLSSTNVLSSSGRTCSVKSGKLFCSNGYACSVFPYGYYYCTCCKFPGNL